MMTYDEFKNYVMENLEGMLPEGDYDISLNSTTKLNNQEKEGIMIRRNNENVAPIVYIDNAFREYGETGNESEVLQHIAATYAEHVTPPEMIDTESIMNFETSKDNIRCRLVNADMNESMLKDLPHKEIGEFAVIYYVQVGDEVIMSTKVTNERMRAYGIDVEELHKVALENQNKFQKPKIIPMEELLYELTGLPTHHPEGAPRVYVLSNEDGMFGAAAMLNPQTTEMIAEEIGDVYALPSCVHEWILVPVEDAPDIEALKEMVENANETVVKPEELLSYNVYKVDRENKTLEIAHEMENDLGEKGHGEISTDTFDKKDKSKVYDEAR